MGLTLSLLAGTLHVLAYALYSRSAAKGDVRPNTVTWTLFVFLTLANMFSLYAVTGADWVKLVLPIASSAACIYTFLSILKSGKFAWPATPHLAAGVVGIIAIVVWKVYGATDYGNTLLSVAILISFFPTYDGVWKDPTAERPRSWVLWAVAYLLLLVVVLLRWNGNRQELVYPICGFTFHIAVALLTLRHSR